MKKKRIFALLCIVLLTVQMAIPAASAAETIFFTAVEDTVQPLTDETMPFISKNNLYISCSVFGGMNWQTLGITVAYNTNRTTAVVYSNQKQAALICDMTDGSIKDIDGNEYFPAPIAKNGQIFAPVNVIARYFDLVSTITEVPHGYLIWLHAPNFGLTDQQFANAAMYNMESNYNAYIRSKVPESSAPAAPVPEEKPVDHKQVYLCIQAGDSSEQMLDALGRKSMQAAFFCTPDFLEMQGDLLRRMTASGQSVGILADAADPSETVEEQLRRGNAGLYQATCGKTRLVYLLNDDGTVRDMVEEAGYHCVKAQLNRAGYQLASTANATALLQQISTRRGDVSVWLGSSATTVGLREFIRVTEEAGSACRAIRETV